MAEDIFEEAGDTHAWRPDEAPAVGEDVFDEAPLQPLRSETGASWLKRILVFGGLLFGVLLVGGGVWLFSLRPGPPVATEPKAHRFVVPEADIPNELIDSPKPAPERAAKTLVASVPPDPAPTVAVPVVAEAGFAEASGVGAAAGAVSADSESTPAVSVDSPAGAESTPAVPATPSTVPAAPELAPRQAAESVPEPAQLQKTASSPPAPDRPAPVERYPLTDQDRLLRQSNFQQAAEKFLTELRRHPKSYAISLEVDCEHASVRSALQNGEFDAHMYVLPRRLGQRNCIAVMWGLYPSAAEAHRAVAELPPYFRTRTPRAAVVPVRRYF